MDFIHVPLIEDLEMDFVKIVATCLEHLNQFNGMGLEATGTEGIIEPAGAKLSYTKSQLITVSYE